jgi:hypothetical protein
MNDNTIIALGVCVCVVSVYAIRSFNNFVLKNALHKESEALRLQLSKAQRTLNEFGAEPEELVTQGLSSLAPLLQNLDVSDDMLKQFGIPAWAVPIAKGFIDKMKAKGAGNSSDTGTPGFNKSGAL